MHEKLLILERRLREDLNALDEIYEDLGDRVVSPDETQEQLIVQAYRLHNIYNACENMFRNIATVFENQIDDKKGWHRELLERMKLDLLPLRPAVIDDAAYEKLDELLWFHHFFRTAYGVSLDPERFAIAQKKALALRKILPEQIEEFLTFLADQRGGE